MNGNPRPSAPTRTGGAGAWGVVLVAGAALVLLAQFFLDGLADGSDTWHWIQHAALFWGGVMAGAAALRLYQLGSRPA